MNQQLWEAIVAKLQELRELTREQYEQQCGLDPEHDRARIDELYRGQRYLAPDYLAPLLEAAVAAIRKQVPDGSPETIKTGIGAAAYGPPRCGPPSDLGRLQSEAAWGSDSDQRSLERLLVHGAKLPPVANRASTWVDRWQYAVDALQYVTQSAYYGREYTQSRAKRLAYGDIRSNLIWLNQHVLSQGPLGMLDSREIAQDELAFAAIVGGGLLGCTCFEHWEDMRLHSEAKGREHCKRHVLDAWNGAMPLNDFVWPAAINRNLPELGDFRRGMLAKEFGTYYGLAVFPVLICDTCGGEIQIDDRCDGCGAADQGTERTTYRLDFKELRIPWHCWRCAKCNRLYFQARERCPHGHTHARKPRPVSVWIRLRRGELPSQLYGPSPGSAERIGDELNRLLTEFGNLSPDQIYRILGLKNPPPDCADILRQFAWGIFVEGRSIQDAAERAGLKGSDLATAEEQIVRILRDLRKRLFGDEDSDLEEAVS